MKTAICELLDIDIPLLAFSHCRDVVAAVTNAGGFGVLGASSHTAEELEAELSWIDDHVGGRPYGADILVPEKFEGKGEGLDAQRLLARIPDAHRHFVGELLRDHGIDTDDSQVAQAVGQALNDKKVEQLLEVSLRHPIKLIANALGVPPQFMIDAAKGAGIPVAALVGAKEHLSNRFRPVST